MKTSPSFAPPPAPSEVLKQPERPRRWKWYLAAAVLPAAASFGFFATRSVPVQEAPAAIGPLRATAMRVAPADNHVSASLADGASTVGEGATLAAGSVVPTDVCTRAELTLSDGSSLIVNRDSEVVVGERERSLTLRRGELMVDVAHLERGLRMELITELGRVEVLDTKLVLTVAREHVSVRVLRGLVRVRRMGRA